MCAALYGRFALLDSTLKELDPPSRSTRTPKSNSASASRSKASPAPSPSTSSPSTPAAPTLARRRPAETTNPGTSGSKAGNAPSTSSTKPATTTTTTTVISSDPSDMIEVGFVARTDVTATAGRGRGSGFRRGGSSSARVVPFTAKTCSICGEEKNGHYRSQDFFSSTPCAFKHEMGPTHEEGHTAFCKQCLYTLIYVRVRDAFTAIDIRCPFPGCKQIIHPYRIHDALKYHVKDDGASLKKFVRLQGSQHKDRLKELFSKQNKTKEEKDTIDWLLNNARYCPKCNVLIEKNDGCNDLLCSCGFHFCFGCGAPHQYCRCSSEFGSSSSSSATTDGRIIQGQMLGKAVCFRCQGLGHKAKDCPHAPPKEDVPAPVPVGAGEAVQPGEWVVEAAPELPAPAPAPTPALDPDFIEVEPSAFVLRAGRRGEAALEEVPEPESSVGASEGESGEIQLGFIYGRVEIEMLHRSLLREHQSALGREAGAPAGRGRGRGFTRVPRGGRGGGRGGYAGFGARAASATAQEFSLVDADFPSLGN